MNRYLMKLKVKNELIWAPRKNDNEFVRYDSYRIILLYQSNIGKRAVHEVNCFWLSRIGNRDGHCVNVISSKRHVLGVEVVVND